MDAELGNRAVAELYDRHPYPPPAADLDAHATAWRDPIRRRVEHHRIWPRAPFRDDHTILVAGCGTSQAARYALGHPNSHVIGIDVSAAGLEHNGSLAQRYGLENLELRQLPIEEVADLGGTFEHIVCTGVLHHLADPDAGLAALRSVLAPEGAMVIMVYAPYGRTGVYMIQEYCRRLGVGSSPAEIADLVASLRELPLGHPLGRLLRETPDFQHDDALADALLHPRDRAYSVPQLFDWLERSEVRFDRWVRQAPYDPRCGAPSDTPHGARMAALEPVERYAAMELFRGTIARHSLIARADDAHAAPRPMPFTGEAWRQYVPILEPTVVIVEQRLPAGVAAAVLNRAHQHTDIVLFVDQHERQVLHAIDGVRPAGELCPDSPDLLERLWRHDLIVFDASAARAETA